MSKFISGVKEQYPKELLQGRSGLEGAVVFSFWKDPSLYEKYNDITVDQFLTEDARFYFSVGKQMSKLYKVFDEVSVNTYLNEHQVLMDGFNERGGYSIIHDTLEMMDTGKIEDSITLLKRENDLLKQPNLEEIAQKRKLVFEMQREKIEQEYERHKVLDYSEKGHVNIWDAFENTILPLIEKGNHVHIKVKDKEDWTFGFLNYVLNKKTNYPTTIQHLKSGAYDDDDRQNIKKAKEYIKEHYYKHLSIRCVS